jgi:hypothetical protein
MKAINQTLLAVIVGLCMSFSFIGVYAVGYHYDQADGVSSEVWTSDSDMTFQELDTSLHTDDLYKNLPNPYGVGTFKQTMVGSIGYYEQNNCTPVYSGNDTWTASMIGWLPDTPDYTHAWHHLPIMIPTANTFIADMVNVSFSLPGDSDQQIQIMLGANDNPEPDDLSSVKSIVIYPVTAHASELWFNHSFDLTMYQKLLWYDYCQGRDEMGIWIYIMDGDPSDGFSSFALELSVKVTGKYVTTWSLQDSVNAVVGTGIGLNILVMVYMSDAVDFGIKRKDLRKRR